MSKQGARVDRAERRVTEQLGEQGETRCQWRGTKRRAPNWCDRIDLLTMWGAIAAHDADPLRGMGWRFTDETRTELAYTGGDRKCATCPLKHGERFPVPDWADPDGLAVGQLRNTEERQQTAAKQR